MTTPSAIYMVNVKFKHRYKLTLETGEDSGERSLYFDHLPTLDGVSGVVLSDFDVGNYGNKIAKLFQQTLRKVGEWDRPYFTFQGWESLSVILSSPRKLMVYRLIGTYKVGL